MTLAWLAFGWARPSFPADALAPGEPPAQPPTAQISNDASADSQPVDAVPFLDTGATTPVAAAPVNKPASPLRFAPIATRVGGNVGYDIEQRTTSGGNALLQQRILFNLKGQARSFIWQPWIAQVNGDFGFTASKNKSNDIGSSSNMILGGAGLNLVPYSRFPFEAGISRTQNNLGLGIGSPISKTTRFEMTQRYRPKHGKESYRVGYIRSKTDSGVADSDRLTGLNFGMTSNRFKNNSIEVDGASERDIRLNDGKSTLLNQALVHHRYLPSTALSLDNNANLTSSSEHAVSGSTSFRNRELNSTLSLQPILTPYSAIGAARVNVSDQSSQATSSQTSSANANLSANYRPSQHFNVSASGNANVTETNSVRTRTVTTSQSANANYPLAATNLDGYRYTSQLSGSIRNQTGRTGSVQSVSLGPSHSLSSGMDFSGGWLALGLNQGVSVSESTRIQASSRLDHSGTANWRRVQGRSDTTLRLNGRDSRSLSRTQDSFQSIDFSASLSEEFSRYSRLSGSLSVRAMRQVSMAAPSAIVSASSSASLHYSHQRAFDVPRLIFDSDVRAYSQAFIPVLAAAPNDQGPVTWENTLSYNVGLLVADFRVNLSKESDGTTQSLIALSLKRYF